MKNIAGAEDRRRALRVHGRRDPAVKKQVQEHERRQREQGDDAVKHDRADQMAKRLGGAA